MARRQDTALIQNNVPETDAPAAFTDRGVDDLATLFAGIRPDIEPIRAE
jgi:hypothetical protein